MRIIQAGFEVLSPVDGEAILKHIERCGRVCYKSEDKITETSAAAFVRNIIQSGHESVLEHAGITVKFIVDRGISHQIVRHRLASYSQESTRYCNYVRKGFGEEITVIEPCYLSRYTAAHDNWYAACKKAEEAYFRMQLADCTPEQARAVLPSSLKTEVVMTANLREWRHFFRLRTSKAAHPQMREVAVPLLRWMQGHIPVVFDDIQPEGGAENVR